MPGLGHLTGGRPRGRLGEAMALRPMVLAADAIQRNPALKDKYGKQAQAYLALAEQIFEKWDKRGCWRETKDGGVWVVPTFGIDEKTGMGLLLSELGVENVQEVLEAMYPEETYEMDRTLEPALPTRITAVVTDPAADAGPERRQLGPRELEGRHGQQVSDARRGVRGGWHRR